MCFDKRVVGGLVVLAALVFLIAPSTFGAALPLLVLAACPLSMIVMMRGMKDSRDGACGAGNTRADEIVRLRAELDQLQAERDAGGREGSDTTSDHRARP